MKAPADQTAVITPLTTLVHNEMKSTGLSSAEAAESVKAKTGINVPLFEDFSKGTTEDHKAAANIARMVVVTTQQQYETVKGAEGTKDSAGTTITMGDLEKLIQKKILEMLPNMMALISDPGVQNALKAAQTKIDSANGTAKAAALTEKDALIKARASDAASNGLTMAGIAINVAINKQQESTAAVVAEAPTSRFNIRALNFTDQNNYYVRFVSGTAAQNTPDSKGLVRYVYNNYKSINGAVSSWNTGSSTNPARQADLHWTGTTWAACKLNFESVASTYDAKGNSEFNYCDYLETGKSSLVSLDISGKKMVDVLGDAVKAGYTNLGTVTDGTKTLLGDTTFPAKSTGFYQNGTTLTTAVAYHPGSGNRMRVETSVPCANTFTSKEATTLEEIVAKSTGLNKCSYQKYTFSNAAGSSVSSGDRNEDWGTTTISLGTIGTASANFTKTNATTWYTTNTPLRAGLGTNGNATFYACKESYAGSTRNCDPLGTGTYSIKTVGDARTLSFSGLPSMAAALDWTRVFIERGGKVYWGYQNRPKPYNSASLNTGASAAVLSKLGLPVVTVDTPLALTQASYQGTWDAFLDSDPSTVWGTGNLSESGVFSCTSAGDICNLTSFNPTTGAFILTSTRTSTITIDGKFDFISGTGTASFSGTAGSGTLNFVRR
jgi:hypothetical protein